MRCLRCPSRAGDGSYRPVSTGEAHTGPSYSRRPDQGRELSWLTKIQAGQADCDRTKGSDGGRARRAMDEGFTQASRMVSCLGRARLLARRKRQEEGAIILACSMGHCLNHPHANAGHPTVQPSSLSARPLRRGPDLPRRRKEGPPVPGFRRTKSLARAGGRGLHPGRTAGGLGATEGATWGCWREDIKPPDSPSYPTPYSNPTSALVARLSLITGPSRSCSRIDLSLGRLAELPHSSVAATVKPADPSHPQLDTNTFPQIERPFTGRSIHSIFSDVQFLGCDYRFSAAGELQSPSGWPTQAFPE